MLAGMFPFARAADEAETNVMRMQRMFTRIIKADYEPLPHVRRHADGKVIAVVALKPDMFQRRPPRYANACLRACTVSARHDYGDCH